MVFVRVARDKRMPGHNLVTLDDATATRLGRVIKRPGGTWDTRPDPSAKRDGSAGHRTMTKAIERLLQERKEA